jgi:leucyl aminopeptidase
VNEPANALGPVEFADKLAALSALGVDVEVLGEASCSGKRWALCSAWRRARHVRRASS